MPALQVLNFDKSATREKTLVVLGVGRGGTSATAGVLRELGVAMPKAHPLKHEWSPLTLRADETVDLEQTIQNLEQQNQRFDCWGWKCPRDCFLLDQFQSHIRNPVLVIVFRNFLDTSVSASRHSAVPWELVVNDNATVLAQLANIITYSALPIVTFAYETLVTRSADVIAELNDALGLNASLEQRQTAKAFLECGYYSKVSFEDNAGLFSAEELARDAAEAQSRSFTSIIGDLEGRMEALSRDLLVAEKIERMLQAEIDEHGPAIVAGDPQVAAEPFDASLSAFAADGDPGSEEPATADADPLASAYQRQRRAYRSVVRDRMNAQRRMDDLSRRLKQLEARAETSRQS